MRKYNYLMELPLLHIYIFFSNPFIMPALWGVVPMTVQGVHGWQPSGELVCAPCDPAQVSWLKSTRTIVMQS